MREIKQQTSTGDWAASPVLTEAERAAAALRAIEQDPNLRRMFETAGLDTSNVLHWQRLLSSLAEIIFARGSPRGRPRAWTPERWIQLLNDFNELKSRHPKASAGRVCGRLTREEPFSSRYENLDAQTLRRNLSYARDPNRNGLLRAVVERRAEAEMRRLELLEKNELGRADTYRWQTAGPEVLLAVLSHTLDSLSNAWRLREKSGSLSPRKTLRD